MIYNEVTVFNVSEQSAFGMPLITSYMINYHLKSKKADLDRDSCCYLLKNKREEYAIFNCSENHNAIHKIMS